MKLYHALLSCLAVSALSLAGCAQPTDNSDEGAEESLDRFGEAVTPARIQKLHTEAKPEQPVGQLSAKTLTYYGGPVLQHVNVVPVYWNSSVANQSQLNAYYAGVTNSAYFDWLKEYNTSSPAQSIGRGTAQAGYVDNRSTTSVTDAQIQAELNYLFSNNLIPQPNANNYYAVHFVKNQSITGSDGSKSCVQFCAYHGTYVRNGVNVYYGVLPDVSSSGCAGGCGASTAFNNETSVASHELIETVTDAAVGIANVYGPPLGWYNATYGEIGDICNGSQGTILGGNGTTYTVQKEWSNVKQTCVTSY